jgi:outer membrane biosynthesis protein TonB
MNSVRSIAVALSLIVHGSFAYALTRHVSTSNEFAAFDAGTGDDQFVVEQGIGIDNIVKLGDDVQTIRTSELTPVETLPTPVQETKPVEELQQAITSVSEKAVDDNIVKTEDPLPEIKPQETKPVEAVEKPVQVAIAKDASSGGEQTGGNATALAEYKGKLVKLFQECKFAPKKRLVGNAQVRIVVNELGKVVNREIVKSSGDPKVDQAALANVDYALNDCKDEGLPKAPEGLTATDRTVIQGYNFK